MKSLAKLCLVAACLWVGVFSVQPVSAQRSVKIDCRQAPIRKSYPIEDFKALEVSSIFDVELIPSDYESVEIVMNPGYADGVSVTKQGQTLMLGLKGSYTTTRHSGGDNCNIKVFIHFKTLNDIKASGAATIDMQGVYDMRNQGNMNLQLSGATEFSGNMRDVNNMNIQLSGSSEVELDLIQAEALKCKASGAAEIKGNWVSIKQMILDLSGSSEISLTGNARDLNFTGSGAAEASLKNFNVYNCTGTTTGAAELRLNVKGTFSGTSSGASEMEIFGSPKVQTISSSGASEIKIR